MNHTDMMNHTDDVWTGGGTWVWTAVGIWWSSCWPIIIYKLYKE